MPTLILDKIDGAELEATRFMARYTRMGTVNDIDLASTSDADALANVMLADNMPAFNTPLSASNPGLRLARVRILPQLEKFRRVRVALSYETIEANFTPMAYLLRDRTFSQNYEGFFIPGTRKVVLVGFDIPIGPGTSAEEEALRAFAMPKTPLKMSFDISIRSLQLTIQQYGRPDGGSAEYVNYVNDDDWPTSDITFGGDATKTARSRPKGYWKLQSYSTDWLRNQGVAMIQAEAATKNIEDWSIVGLLRHEKTGRYPFGSLPGSEQLFILTTMAGRDYENAVIYPRPDVFIGETDRGLVRVGPYPTTNFTDLFNF